VPRARMREIAFRPSVLNLKLWKDVAVGGVILHGGATAAALARHARAITGLHCGADTRRASKSASRWLRARRHAESGSECNRALSKIHVETAQSRRPIAQASRISLECSGHERLGRASSGARTPLHQDGTIALLPAQGHHRRRKHDEHDGNMRRPS